MRSLGAAGGWLVDLRRTSLVSIFWPLHARTRTHLHVCKTLSVKGIELTLLATKFLPLPRPKSPSPSLVFIAVTILDLKIVTLALHGE